MLLSNAHVVTVRYQQRVQISITGVRRSAFAIDASDFSVLSLRHLVSLFELSHMA